MDTSLSGRDCTTFNVKGGSEALYSTPEFVLLGIPRGGRQNQLCDRSSYFTIISSLNSKNPLSQKCDASKNSFLLFKWSLLCVCVCPFKIQMSSRQEGPQDIFRASGRNGASKNINFDRLWHARSSSLPQVFSLSRPNNRRFSRLIGKWLLRGQGCQDAAF